MIALEKRRGKEMLKKIFQKAATVSEDVTKAHVGAVSIFFHALYDPDHPSFTDFGAVYACDKSGCDDGGNAGVPFFCGFADDIYC